MVTGWRIVTAKYKNDAFSGEGARIQGGRWNSKGVPMVYTAGSLALALLEILVSLPAAKLLQEFVRIPIRFSLKLVTSLEEADLPADWNSRPASSSTKKIGDQWVASKESVILKVPSIVVPEEYNYLVNPLHPDFKKISIGSSVAYFLDPRLKK